MNNNINEKYKSNKYIDDNKINNIVNNIIKNPNTYYNTKTNKCVINYNNVNKDNEFLCTDTYINNCYIKIDFNDNKKKLNYKKDNNQSFIPNINEEQKNLEKNKEQNKEQNKKLINIKDYADENLAGDNLNIKNNYFEEDLKKINDILKELNNTNIKIENKDNIINIIENFKNILLGDNIFLKSYDNQNQNEIRNIIDIINNISK
jgi:hypothetical protein